MRRTDKRWLAREWLLDEAGSVRVAVCIEDGEPSIRLGDENGEITPS